MLLTSAGGLTAILLSTYGQGLAPSLRPVSASLLVESTLLWARSTLTYALHHFYPLYSLCS